MTVLWKCTLRFFLGVLFALSYGCGGGSGGGTADTGGPATPVITWTTPAAIIYGTALSATQLNASANAAGTFVYSPAQGEVLAAGTHTLAVTFTPADASRYTAASATQTLTIDKATPVITWPTPASINAGTTLSATQLAASANVAGGFSYSPAAGTVLAAGTHTLTATFTPTDSLNYTTASATQSLTVAAAGGTGSTPTITWSAPAAITYGTALSTSQLNASASVPGTFVYSPAAGAVLAAGMQMLSVTFTPTDTSRYTVAIATRTLTVNKATPVISWATPASIGAGTALSATQLNATTSIAGTFAYVPAAGTVLAIGTHNLTVTFTPNDTANFNGATATQSLSVAKATPVITWATPAAITYGTTLSTAQLNATASAAGTFSYSPAVGAVLNAGSQTLSTTFTPTDTATYATATKTVTLSVQKATPTITWDTPVPVYFGSWIGSATLSAKASVAGAFTYAPAQGSYISTLGSLALSTTFTPTDTNNYNTATASQTLTVMQGVPTVVWSMPAAVVQGTALSSTQLNASVQFGIPGTITYSPASGTVMNAPGTVILTAQFTPSNTTNYRSVIGTTALTVLPSAGTALVDFGDQQQEIRGFGGSEAWSGTMAAARMKALFGQDPTDLGLSIIRLRIAPTTWNSTTKVAGTNAWTAELNNGKAAQTTYGASVFASSWTPPGTMKINNASRASNLHSGILNPSSYGDYAEYLNAYIKYATVQGVNLYAISMQNEPDFDPQDYESCLWTPEQMRDWVANNGPTAIGTSSVKLMMPESFYFSAWGSTPALNDATAVNNFSIVGGHLYGSSPSYPKLAKDKGKEVWMTEHFLDPLSKSDSASMWPLTVADAVAAAKEIHNSMTLGQYNAYVWWWLVNSNDNTPTGLITSGNQPTYFGTALKHYAYFIRPGYHRYNATSQPLSNIHLSAYAGSGKYVVVIINAGNTDVNLPVQLSNAGGVTSLSAYRTDASGSFQSTGVVAVNGGDFTAALPKNSITTFVQ